MYICLSFWEVILLFSPPLLLLCPSLHAYIYSPVESLLTPKFSSKFSVYVRACLTFLFPLPLTDFMNHVFQINHLGR